MKVVYRRLTWFGLYVASLAIVALVAAYLGRNLTGSGPVPTRSAFAGRLPGSPDGNWRRFRFFYATNRATDPDNDAFNVEDRSVGRRRGPDITTGTFDVRISPYMPIEPWIWFDKKYMEWVGQAKVSQDDSLARLREAVQASPQKSVLVIVWGFRDSFTTAALKTAYTGYVLDIDTPVLMFDWPGNQGDGASGYRAARQMSYESAPDLGRVLARVVRDSGAEHIWLMGSSLGCQTICDAFACLEAQPELFQGNRKIDHVVLSAPDVSAQAFDDKFAARVSSMSRHLTAYVSSNDRALLLSHWLTGERRLGRPADVSVPPEDRTSEYEFEEAQELLDLKAKGAGSISSVDATPINRTRNLHHFFTDSPEFFDDLYRVLLQPDNMVSRRLHTLRTQKGTTYWILWSD
jgi:esterase/lipase superfamily enzyme